MAVPRRRIGVGCRCQSDTGVLGKAAGLDLHTTLIGAAVSIHRNAASSSRYRLSKGRFVSISKMNKKPPPPPPSLLSLSLSRLDFSTADQLSPQLGLLLNPVEADKS